MRIKEHRFEYDKSKLWYFDPTKSPWYAGPCPHCRAACMIVNCSWAECISPYCKKPYSINGIWVEDCA